MEARAVEERSEEGQALTRYKTKRVARRGMQVTRYKRVVRTGRH